MLKGDDEVLDMEEEKNQVLAQCGEGLEELEEELGEECVKWQDHATTLSISYPVQQYPSQIKSLNLEKKPHIEGTLWGIKGQYLIFDTGVFNVRKASGYKITLS